MDENPKKTVIPPGYRMGPIEDDPPDVEGPAQFGIGWLLAVQAGFAFFLFLLLTTGIFAAFVALVATILLQWGHYRLRNVALRRVVFDLMAGVAMPILCLWYDPGLFDTDNTYRVRIYLLLAFQMVALPSWLIYQTLTRRANGLFAGVLGVGCLFAVIIGAISFVPSLILLVVFVGLLGFTPLLTAYVFGRNARWAMQLSPDQSRLLHVLLAVLGVALAIGLPLLVDMAYGEVLAAWIERISFPRFRLGF